MFDLGPAAAEMQRLVARVRDDQLTDRTPCAEWDVADLLVHVHQFASVFTANACKGRPQPPHGLVGDWQQAIPDQLQAMARAWRQESAWQGRVSAGGIEMNAADNAVVGIEELTVHGWDLARATGQDFDADDACLDHVEAFFDLFGEQPFGRAAPIAEGATRLERTVARTGRDPAWSSAA